MNTLKTNKILATQQFSAEVSRIFSSEALAYKKGMGIKLFKQAPPEIQEKAMNQLKNLAIKKGDLMEIDRALLNIQIDICKTIHKQQQERINAEITSTERLMNAFDKVEVKVPELSSEQKLFTDLPGSNIDKHLARVEGLLQAVEMVRESPVYKKPPSQMSSEERQQVNKSITAVVKEMQSVEKEFQTLKPDEVTVDSAFIEATKKGEHKKIDALRTLGYWPRPIAQEKIQGILVQEGTMGKQTIQTGKAIGLGEQIEVKATQENHTLLSNHQVATFKRDPLKTLNPSPSKQTQSGVLAKNKADSIYIESSPGNPSKNTANRVYKKEFKMDLEAEIKEIARRHKLEIRMDAGYEQPMDLDINKQQTLSPGR